MLLEAGIPRGLRIFRSASPFVAPIARFSMASAETKELVGGLWIWQVRSMEEPVEWVGRCPKPREGHGVSEIRKLFEAQDFAQQS